MSLAKRRIIRYSVVSVVAAASLLLSACSAPTPDSQPDEALTVNFSSAPGTIDPAQACEASEVAFTGNLYTRLTQYGTKPGPDGTQQFDASKIEPWLAKSWDISEDGLVYTFNLVEGAVFPSGEPMDAEAVKYSFERVLTTNGCGAYFVLDGFYDPPMISTIEAPDANTVVITLNKANANALQDWAQAAAGIVDKTVVEANGGVVADTVNEWMGSHSAGGGPFLLESYDPSTRAVLVANPDYFGEQPASSKILVNFVADNSTLQLQASSGAADVTVGLSKIAAADLAESGKARIIANDSTQSTQIRINSTRPGLDNNQVRQALAYAVPYDDIIESVASGYATAFNGPFTPVIPQFNPELGKAHETDMEKAKQLMADSGVTLPLSVELLVSAGIPGSEQIGTILQSVWGEIGVDVTVSSLADADFSQRNSEGDYEVAMGQDGPGVVDGGFYLGYATGCADPFAGYSVCVPGVDEILADARGATDPVVQQDLYDQITTLWNDYATMIQVYADKTVVVLSPDVTTYTYSPVYDMRTWGKK